MDLSAKVLREVEFRDRLRGYDTDEVDEFLEKVAVAVEELQEKMRQLVYRAERAERSISERGVDADDDTIRRTLVLAQRTADMAVREAQEQAAVLMDGARNESEKLLGEARESAKRLQADAERRHSDDIARLERQRDKVRDELKELSELLDSERKRLAESLRAALRFVERTLPGSGEISSIHPTSPPSETRALDEQIEAQINEDAETAAPSLMPAEVGTDAEAGDAGAEEARASLAAVPPLEDSGPPTQAWQAEPMTIFSEGGDKIGGVAIDPGARQFGAAGPDWIA
ncbi:MAG: DivIVA domain-containing protein [Acidimicrobiales bacterium]|jgi:cell division initiation protein